MCEHYYHFDSQNHGVCIFCEEEQEGRDYGKERRSSTLRDYTPDTWLWKVVVIVTTVIATVGVGLIIQILFGGYR